jgi:hypothetical protein
VCTGYVRIRMYVLDTRMYVFNAVDAEVCIRMCVLDTAEVCIRILVVIYTCVCSGHAYIRIQYRLAGTQICVNVCTNVRVYTCPVTRIYAYTYMYICLCIRFNHRWRGGLWRGGIIARRQRLRHIWAARF